MSRRFRRAFMETICRIHYPSNRGPQSSQYSMHSKGKDTKMPLIERHNHNNSQSYTANGSNFPLRSARQLQHSICKQNSLNGVQNNVNCGFHSSVLKPTLTDSGNQYLSRLEDTTDTAKNKYLMESRFVSNIAKHNKEESLGVYV